jgi:hypothetical protein
MHANVEADAETEEEDLNQGENISCRRKKEE